MKNRKVMLITFSPTRTSYRVGEAIAQGIKGTSLELLDLTLIDNVDTIDIPKDTIAIFSFPVYGGFVAPLAMQRLSSLKAEGVLAITVVVYGNRAFENALTQLDSFVTERGCKVIAAAGFIGEHSYSNAKYPIASARPNKDDLSFAKSFGEKVLGKISSVQSFEQLQAVNTKDISLPEQSDEDMIAFFSDIKQAKINGIPFPQGPSTDEKLCNNCAICHINCPTKAIVKGDECNTDYEKCIKCCACIKLCPQGARSMDTPYSLYLNRYFSKEKENVTIL